MPEPTRFLRRDWMMLTLGLRLRNTTTAQRELIAELDEGGVCALGLGVGVAFKRLPHALLDEADARHFPVVEIPFETPYREIVGFVNRSLLSSDFRTLHRSLSMQNYLMDALRDEAPVEALVARLGNLLDSTVLLFAADGSLEAASGEAPVAGSGRRRGRTIQACTGRWSTDRTSSPQVLLFEDLRLASWPMGVTPGADLRARATGVLEPLLDHPLLYDTLLAYLCEGMNVAATARAMFHHHNSLRYRPARIEELLGCSLRDVPTLVDLYLASLVKGSIVDACTAPPSEREQPQVPGAEVGSQVPERG